MYLETPKGQERGRETSDEAIGMAGVATDTLGVWLQANQQVLHNLLELSTSVAQQTIRLLADVQQANLQAMQEMQANRLRGHHRGAFDKDQGLVFLKKIPNPLRRVHRGQRQRRVAGDQRDLCLTRQASQIFLEDFVR